LMTEFFQLIEKILLHWVDFLDDHRIFPFLGNVFPTRENIHHWGKFTRWSQRIFPFLSCVFPTPWENIPSLGKIF
jgi:hypothetical protein